MGGFWKSTKEHVASQLGGVIGAKVNANELVTPPRAELGDLTLPCFELAKTLQTNPAELAKKIVAEYGNGDRLIEKLTAQGPFVNVTLKTGEFIHRIIRDIETQEKKYGESNVGKGKPLIFEYAQPNTHKEMHVGHVRNLVLGSSIVSVLRHAGWNVIPVSYHGDVGAHVAKCLWWFVENMRQSMTPAVTPKADMEEKPGKKKIKKGGKTVVNSPTMDLGMKEVEEMLELIPAEKRNGAYLGSLYTQATNELAADPERQAIVSQVQQALESEDPVWHKLWQETRRWSLEEMKALFEELGLTIDRMYLESDVVGEGQRMVDDLLKKGVAKMSEGAIIVDLEDAGLGVFLIRKSDGTSLYATKDLALAYRKLEDYPKAERSIMLVDNRQSLYFRQLFETLTRLGYKIPNEHIGYEFVTLKSGAMSSREGNVVTYQSFRDDVYKYAWEETTKRHSDWAEGQVRYNSWFLALAGIKFGMLRQDPDKVYTFDMKEALSFEGDTGPYVQYTVVRINSILKKANLPGLRGSDEPDCRVLGESQEKQVALALGRFADVVERAGAEMRPGQIAIWCLETARLANAFYRDIKVLEADEAHKNPRLRLCYAIRDTLTLGLMLLGVPVPEEM